MSKNFELMYKQLEDLSRAFPEYQFKTVGSMLLILGWLITASSAQEFISAHSTTILPATSVVLVLLVVLKAAWIWRHCRKINLLYSKLEASLPDEGLTSDSIENLKMGLLLPVSYIVVNTVLCIAIFVAVKLITQ